MANEFSTSPWLTVIFPGLRQAQARQYGRAATLFLCAVVLLPFTGPVGWLTCGVWSLLAPLPAAPASSPTSGSAGQAPGSPPVPPTRGFDAAAWLKFAVLASGVAIAFFAMTQGRALSTLEFVGIKMTFESSMVRAAHEGEREPAAPAGEPMPAAVGLAGPGAPTAPSASLAALVPRVGATPVANVAGSWMDPEGVRYEIVRTGDAVRIREVSQLFFIPIETGTCDGSLADRVITAHCTTYLGTTGILELTLDPRGTALAGSYRDLLTGGWIPIRLAR